MLSASWHERTFRDLHLYLVLSRPTSGKGKNEEKRVSVIQPELTQDREERERPIFQLVKAYCTEITRMRPNPKFGNSVNGFVLMSTSKRNYTYKTAYARSLYTTCVRTHAHPFARTQVPQQQAFRARSRRVLLLDAASGAARG